MRSKVFRTNRRGLAAVLGPLEATVMGIVWSSSDPVSVSDVVQVLARRKNRLAYSTIKTILTNLAHKGYLRKHAAGRANLFEAAQSRTDFEHDAVVAVVDSLLRDYRNPLLSHLADELADDPQSIADFERLLAQRKKQRSSDA